MFKQTTRELCCAVSSICIHATDELVTLREIVSDRSIPFTTPIYVNALKTRPEAFVERERAPTREGGKCSRPDKDSSTYGQVP
jgi:hypothetical protein